MKKVCIAITGPSGVGKTTLGNILVDRNNFVIPKHTTTREPRKDDQEGFYNYLTHDEFKKAVLNNEFLFWSGDSEIISKTNGNYYGILNPDFKKVETDDKIIIYISYKDVSNLLELIKNGKNIKIVNLVYDNISVTMAERLNNDERNHSKEDIQNRIRCAINYEKEFYDIMHSDEIYRLSTEQNDIEKTYCKVLKMIRK